MDKSNLIEVRPHMYLSKSDPNFFKKYITYFPDDRKALFSYGEELLKEGSFKEGLSYLEKSSKLGYRPASLKIEQFYKLQTQFNKQQRNKNKNHDWLLPIFLLVILCLLLFLLFFIPYFLKINHFYKTENHYYEEKVIHHNAPPASDVGSESNKESESPSQHDSHSPVYSTEQLHHLVLLNAIERFKEEKEAYPESLEELVLPSPENWISFVSDDYFYENKGHLYTLLYSKENKSVFSDDLLQLHFYPTSNELGLVHDGNVLALYPVASGENTLPFTKSNVSLRVVEPNGKNSSLGSRGLLLEDNIAIHGTNDPTSIGEYVTQGCLRMLNEDIEELYPYISKGTPFVVMEQKPDKTPVFSDGLPSFVQSLNPFEKTPGITYHWKN